MNPQTVNLNEVLNPITEAWLVPVNSGRSVPLLTPMFFIGRATHNNLCVVDPYVSHRHCKIDVRNNRYFISDLRSRNGTYVNGVKVTEAQLIDGAQIRIGCSNYMFQNKNSVADDTNLPVKSKNAPWSDKLRSLQNLSNTDLAVFLQGESGCGKEILAKAIHDLSLRKDRPFIGVNCSALTESLIESELFGHIKGSFTGASGDRKGAFEAARGGTLFLDEIGDLPPSLQPKLLRALENREIRPVGSDRIVSTDVRIITATHKNLERLVGEGTFRADLYFRIHVVKLSIPPLRERLEDFEDIFYEFCREYRVRFSVPAIEELKKHPWPGNIRELKNVVARASALFPDCYVQPGNICQLLDQPFPIKSNDKSPYSEYVGSPTMLRDIEKKIIRDRLIANRGNQRRTAIELGIPKSTLHDRIKNYGIEVKSFPHLDRLKKEPLNPTVVQEAVDS